jgi:tRNA pseudouridine13 synthase
MKSKDTRTAFHKVIRELFGGNFETETDSSSTPEGSARITVKWAHQGQRNRGQGRGGRRNDAGKFF